MHLDLPGPFRSRRAGAALAVGVLVLAALPTARASRGASLSGLSGVDLRRDSTLEPLRGKAPFTSQEDYRAPLPVEIDGEVNRLALTTVTRLPGETAVFRVPPGAEVVHSAGRLSQRGEGRVAWIAPDEPGIHALVIRSPEGAEVHVTLLVAHPASDVRGGVLNGYRIGAYRAEPLRGDPAYLPPTGFVEVRPGDHDVRVAPHFTLGEFLCKQAGNPKYVVVSPPLLLKLELVLDAVNREGIPARGLTVMSGYRTPFYNRAIGNTTDYSRHLWGDAADVYVDEDGDGEMDDLDGDGTRTVADARVLARLIERVAAAEPPGFEPGGLASYRRNPAHGPFVHVDARGYRARW